MIKLNNSHIWIPDYIATDIFNIDIDTLRHLGITHLVFDLDNTLLLRRTNTISPDYIKRIAELRGKGFTVLLGSNTRRDIASITDTLGISSVRSKFNSIKPFPSFYKRVIEASHTAPGHIAFVGDHMFNDVIGPNRAGMTSILVHSLSTRRSTLNAWYLKYLRKYRNSE